MIPLRLGVNVDHVATVRNARGGTHPDPVRAAALAIAAGADGITMHLREDRRHIRDDDVARVRAELLAPLNLEMAATDEMVRIARRLAPHACCLVPERRAEITTEGGLDAAGQLAELRGPISALRDAGIRVSLFVDPDPRQLEAAVTLGAPVVELHTGAYAENRAGELARLQAAATHGASLGLEIHAGHGLAIANIAPIVAIGELRELNIGHALIGDAIFDGIAVAIGRMKAVMSRSDRA